MKNAVLLLLLSIILTGLFGCNFNKSIVQNSSIDSKNSLETSALLDLSFYDDGVVGGISGGISDGKDNFGLLNEAKTISISQLPVYVDLYPHDPAGAPINDITDVQMKSLVSGHKRIINLLMPGVKVDYSTLNKDEFTFPGVSSTINGMTIRTNMMGTHISNVALSVNGLTTSDEILTLLDSPSLLKAACVYLKISKPVVKLMKNYTIDGKSSSSVFTIYEQGTDDFTKIYNSSWNVIEIHPNLEKESCTVRIITPTKGEEKGMYKAISYVTAASNLRSGNYISDAVSTGNVKTEDILGVDIVYKANLKTGYYIPFYRFACRSADSETIDADKTMYEYCYLPAVIFED